MCWRRWARDFVPNFYFYGGEVRELLNSTDVFVIGGGPAGLAAAIAARQQGFRVIVADGARMPIDKPCGEGLMPDGLAALQELGICLEPQHGYPFRGVRFVSSALAVEAKFPNGTSGMGVRRPVLHRLIADHAATLGIDFLWQTPVTGIAADGVYLGSRKVSARWIIGADGGSSRVRRWARFEVVRKRDIRYAFRQHYSVAPWTDSMELHWGRQGQIYVTPVANDQVCVALISHNPKLRLTEALERFPELKRGWMRLTFLLTKEAR